MAAFWYQCPLPIGVPHSGPIGAPHSGLIGKYLSEELSLNEIIQKISINPRKLLNLKYNSIEEGNYADLTLFNPYIEWKYLENDIISKSKNTPFIGESLKGKAIAIYNNNNFSIL